MSLLDTASLIVTPNGYKEGKLYSVIPSDGSGDMSVVRATTATRVNSAGLVELVPYNLLEYSEQFDNAYWTKSSTTITANTTISPNGLQDADTAIFSSNGQIYRAISSNAVNTFSTYVKKGTNQYFSIQLETNSVVYRAIYDLDTTAVTFTGTNTSASITDVGNGWFRVSVVNTTSDAIAYTTIQAASSGTSVSGGSGTFYIWGAQLVEGSVAKDYQKTETRLNIPRLDYSNGTCPSLLVEPQRTNLLTYSSSFDNAAWSKIGGNGGSTPIVTANYGISPDGTQNADRIQLARTNGVSSYSYVYQAITATIGQSYTWSVWLKSLSGTPSVSLSLDGAFYTNIVTLTNEWQRYEFTTTAFGSNIEAVFILFQAVPSTSLTADFLAYGFQLEAGSYATSYIPTTSASVTRNADEISKTGISSLIGQTEGTMFIDYNYDAKPDTNGNLPMVIYDGSNEAYIFITSGGSVRLELYNGGVLQGSIAGSIGAVGRKKIAFGYKQNDFVGYMNGVQIATDNNGTVGAMSNLYVGSYYTASYNANGGINAAALWKTRLTNAQLATLTTI